MTAKSLELDYGDAEALYAGRHEEERPLSYVGGSVSMDLIDREGLKDAEVSEDVRDMENIALEGRLIARRIHEIMDGGMVMEKNGTFRPIKYGDIVILLRSIAGKGPQLMKVLEENHIPAVSDKEEDFMENSEVEVLWALLKILDNPRQDLALAAVLRSFFAGLDEKDLSLLYLERYVRERRISGPSLHHRFFRKKRKRNSTDSSTITVTGGKTACRTAQRPCCAVYWEIRTTSPMYPAFPAAPGGQGISSPSIIWLWSGTAPRKAGSTPS